MKILQLYRTVCLFGFGRTGERIPKELFLAATELAVRQLCETSPLTAVKTLTVGKKNLQFEGLLCFPLGEASGEMVYDTAAASIGEWRVRAFIHDGMIYIPIKNAAGLVGEEISLTYIRRPTLPDGDAFDSNCELDVADEAVWLLPYLVASTVWADLEPELAATYAEFFRAHVTELAATGKKKKRAAGVGVSYSMPWLAEA